MHTKQTQQDTKLQKETGPNSCSWKEKITGNSYVRICAGFGGAMLAVKAASDLGVEQGRGPSAAIVLGIILVYWGIYGRVPSWFGKRI